ncbi:hypothetical protein COX05_03250 [candidate division WWE3 bacterium CG22_combo_CG10-13_8_21_14_all_39_12]|uniref:Mur ligase central domain-containing protein n=1 Tax=candidate division WWE3 bacterium CG22_combo_CG10-13_8_21_14_all_39_12 TaxID=1975094 RepID=A0A2H0BFF8_UNCKA|nr:MAG: hypothetical protein COX05_03250 [candidate division WWE3 bacterium CG22_combo_CG10-13_8_21_14_all_39_12]
MNFIYWLYQWQLKGYRRDRMVLFIQSLTPQDRVRLLLSGQRKRPKITIKIVLISLTAAVIVLFPLVTIPKLSLFWVVCVAFLVVIGGPFAIAAAVFLWSIPSFFVERFLLFLAKRKRAMFPSLIVIGVTGSYGKTTTKEVIADVLSEKFKVLRTPKSANGEIGVALHALRYLDASYDVYVVEMGAYYQGVIKLVADAMKPKIGVMTGLNEQHAGLFGGKENIIKAKMELIDALDVNGTAVLNVADKNVEELVKNIDVAIMTYESRNVDQNVQAARVVGALLGMTEDQIAQGISHINPQQSRMQITKVSDNLSVIDDTYNSNSTGFRAAVEKLVSIPADRHIVVCTGVYELGEESQSVNSALDQEIFPRVDGFYIVEPFHAKYYAHAKLVVSAKQLYDEMVNKVGSVAVLFEGRSLINLQTMTKLTSNS